MCPTIFQMSQDSSLALSSPREPQSEEKPQKSLIEKQQVDILFRSSSFFMLIIFSGAGKPKPANQVYFTRSRILWGQAYCCLPELQIPSPMKVIWGWKNQCIWSYHSDNRCSNRGITDLCFTWFLYLGCLKIVTTVNSLVGPGKLNWICLMGPRYFTRRMIEN